MNQFSSQQSYEWRMDMNAWLTTQIGADAAKIVSYSILFVAACIILWLLILIVNRFSKGSHRTAEQNHKIRLSVCDAALIDNKRRLVLIKRDNVEHLILIGGPTDLIIENNIIVEPSISDDVTQDIAQENMAVSLEQSKDRNTDFYNSTLINEIKSNINDDYQNDKLENHLPFNSHISSNNKHSFSSKIASLVSEKNDDFADYKDAFSSKNDAIKNQNKDLDRMGTTIHNDAIANNSMEKQAFDKSLKINVEPQPNLMDRTHLLEDEHKIASCSHDNVRENKKDIYNNTQMPSTTQAGNNSIHHNHNLNQIDNVSEKPLKNVRVVKEVAFENKHSAEIPTTTNAENASLNISNNIFGQSKPINPYERMRKVETLHDNSVSFTAQIANKISNPSAIDRDIGHDVTNHSNTMHRANIVNNETIAPLNKMGVATSNALYNPPLEKNIQNTNNLMSDDNVQGNVVSNNTFNQMMRQDAKHVSLNGNQPTTNFMQASQPQVMSERATPSHEPMVTPNGMAPNILRPPLMTATHNFTSSVENNAAVFTNDIPQKQEDVAAIFQNADNIYNMDKSVAGIPHNEQDLQTSVNTPNVYFDSADIGHIEQDFVEKHNKKTIVQNKNAIDPLLNNMSDSNSERLQKFSLQLLDPQHILDKPNRNETSNYAIKTVHPMPAHHKDEK